MRRRSRLASGPVPTRDLVMAMNAKLNGRIAEEVGDDNGSFVPIRSSKWFFPRSRSASFFLPVFGESRGSAFS